MSEPVRAEGRYVTVTAKPGVSSETLEAIGKVVALCDEAADLGMQIGTACEAYEVIFGREMLLALLDNLTAALRAEGDQPEHFTPLFQDWEHL